MTNKNTNVAVLDYDGYICKAFFATLAKDENAGIDEMMEILMSLEKSAEEKAESFFNGEEFKIIRAVSGHTFKKDIYPSYKLSRKKNEQLGYFREYVKDELSEIITCIPFLEADDIIVSIASCVGIKSLVFSDDKDLKYYCYNHCKINITENIESKDYFKERLEQFLVGDREDNVTGIPKVGEVTARKILEANSYTLESIIRAYRDKEIDIDECAKNLILITPIMIPVEDDFTFNSEKAYRAMLADIEVMTDKIKEVYING